MANDPLSFLDTPTTDVKSDPLSFLNQKEEVQSSDPLSFLETPQQSEEPGFWSRVFNRFGEANVLQMKSGGPSGAPSLSPEQAKRVATEVGTIATVEAAFIPILGLAAKSVAPTVVTALTRLTQAGTTGAATATTSKLIEEGELPTKEELIKNGLTWAAIDAIMQGLHITAAGGKVVYDFGAAVNKIAKEEKVPATKVLSRLWDATKNYVKSKFGRDINAPENIRPEDVEILVKEAQQAEEQLPKPKEIEEKPIEIKPIEEAKQPIKEEKISEGNSKETPNSKDTAWYLPGKKKPFAYTPKATGDMIAALVQEGDTYKDIYNKINYDPEAKKIIKHFIDNGYGDSKIELFNGHIKPPEKSPEEKPIEEPKKVPEKKKIIDFENIDDQKKNLERFNKEIKEIENKKHINAEDEHKLKVLKLSKESTIEMIKELEETGKISYLEEQPIESEKAIIKDKIKDSAKEVFKNVLAGNEVSKSEKNILKNIQVSLLQTRGQDQQFHGTRKPIKELNPEIYDTSSPQNIYGAGFYTTDALDIADGYSKTKKSIESTVYQVTEIKPQNIYNAEKSFEEFKKWWIEKDKKYFNLMKEKAQNDNYSGYEKFRGTFEDYHKQIELSPIYLLDEIIYHEKPTSVRDLYDKIRDYAYSKEMSAIDFQGYFEEIQQILEKQGYEGISHKGGLLTNNPEHTVKIYWKPENLKIKEFVYPKEFKKISKISKLSESTVNPKNSLNKLKGIVKPLSSKKKFKSVPSQTARKQPVMGKKQAVARSKVIKLFRKAFKDPIRIGKFKSNIPGGVRLGFHRMWQKVTRLLHANDVETAAHEIGHNLHTFLYGGDAATPQIQSANIDKALKPYLDELKPLAHYAPFGKEGFAEFTRLYVTNPDVAKQLAPKFYAKFEADLDAQYPEMKNALLEAREYYDAYLQGTPESRIRAQTSYASDQGKIANMIEWVKKNLNLDVLETKFLDDVFPAKRLVAEAFDIQLADVDNLKDPRNLYRALRVLKGAIGKADVFVSHETFNAKTLDKINGSFKDILKQLPNEEAYREFNDYLIARRSIEKIGQEVETGIHIGDAIEVEQKLRPKYGKLAQELDKYNDTLLQYATESGLLSGEQYAEIKKNNLMYVPFQRVMEPEKRGIASGAGKLQAGKPIKRMKGSTRDIIAPIESVLKNTYSIIINAEKNLAGQVLAELSKMKDIGRFVERLPTPIKLKSKIEGLEVEERIANNLMKMGFPDLVEAKVINGKATFGLKKELSQAIPDLFTRFGAGQYPAGENIITVYEKGKPTYYEVSPELFEMWNKGLAPYTAGLITKILRMPAKALRAGAILNPKFIQKNAIRDTWGGWLFTRYGKSLKDPVGLFIDTLYSPLAMLATSARSGKLYVEWLKSGGGMSTMQSLDREAIGKKLDEVRHGYKPYQIIKYLRAMAEVSEEANRLAEFGRALEAEGNTRLGREIAAFASRDLSIDFAKMGLLTKAMNQITSFFNAQIQGTDKLVRTLLDPKQRLDFLARAIGFIVLPALILAWLNKNDEDIEELGNENDFNFITNVNGTYIKIPVPFETGVMVNGLTQRMFKYFMKKDPEAFEGLMGSILQSMLPNFIPTIANPLIETYANKSFFTGGRLIPAGKEALISRYQYKNNTSMSARLIGRAMTYMLGQDTRSKAASPAIIDHFIHSWTGGLGRLIVEISDEALVTAGLSDERIGPDKSVIDKLGLNAFIARYPRANTKSIEKFYDFYQDATARQKSFKFAEKTGIEDSQLENSKERFDKLYNYETLQRAYKAIQSSQKAINNIWNDPDIDNALKQDMIDDLYKQQIEFAKSANEDIRRYRLVD